MPTRSRPSAARRAAAALLLLATAACGRLGDAGGDWHGTPLEPALTAPPLALERAGGQRFDLAAERGRVSLVFFGYTQCPDVCPTTLATWARARQALGADTADVRFVFVSVDPERDRPDAAEAYARKFHPSFLGVSGTPGEVGLVTSRWGIAVTPEAAPDAPDAASAGRHAGHAAPAGDSVFAGGTPAGMTLAHTARTFLVDREGRLRLIYAPTTSAEDLAADLRRLLD